MAWVRSWGCRTTTLKRLFISSRLRIRMVYAVFFFALTVFLFSSETIFKRFSRSTSRESLLLTVLKSNEPEEYTSVFSATTGSCELPMLDPWDPTIASFLDPSYNPNRACKQPADFEVLTKLEDGILTFTTSSYSDVHTCSYSCLLPESDWSLIFGEWSSLNNSAVPSCEVVEVACSKSNLRLTANESIANATYRQLHAQVVPKARKPSSEDDTSIYRPSVVLIVLDSASRSSLLRAMPNTFKVLTETYGAVDFRGLNKVGENSAPNALAFLNGLTSFSYTDVGIEQLPSAESDKLPNYCDQYLNSSSFIGSYFGNAGYITMMAEDSFYGVYSWPNCKGFKEKPTDHYMRPFQLRMALDTYSEDSRSLFSQMQELQCKENHEDVVEYQKQFLNAYPVTAPKFSLIWLAGLAHDSVNGLFHLDDYFAQYFREQQAQLSDSFVFFMGDHGLRFGAIRETDIGEIEDNNPMLVISVPEKLRNKKQLMKNLRTNADRLVSHFDIFTTLFDIASVAGRSNWTDFDSHNWVEEEGFHERQTSLLRPIDPGRNCRFMQISEAYCICKTHEEFVPKNDTIVVAAAQFMTDQVMKVINESDVRNICADLSLYEVEKAAIRVTNNFVSDKKQAIYKVTFRVAPSYGIFQGLVKHTLAYSSEDQREKGYFRMLSDRVSRIDAYGNSSHCVHHANLRPICYCRDLLL